MKKLDIGKCIFNMRKKSGITQEQLASYIGVSKASVSKWETGLSCPDIMLLPEIATYFNVSIDYLLGYSPQLGKNDIKKIYNELSREFTVRPFEEMIGKCSKMIKKYYSCFPFLLSMVQLLLNYSSKADSDSQKNEVFDKCILLCKRVKKESRNVSHIKDANTKEAIAEMIRGNSDRVIQLLDNEMEPYSGDDVMLVGAYNMKGQDEKARKVNQILIFNKSVNMLTLVNSYLSLNLREEALFEKIYLQGLNIIKQFGLYDIFTNDVFSIHITAAGGYIFHKKDEKALDAVSRYVDTVCKIRFPIAFKGNKYFDKIEGWFENNNCIGTNTPLDEATIKKNFMDILLKNTMLEPLKKYERYSLLVKRLEEKLGGKDEIYKN